MGQAYLMRRGGGSLANGLYGASGTKTSLDWPGRKNELLVIGSLGVGVVYAQAERPENAEAGDVWAKTGAGDDIDVDTRDASIENGILLVEQYDGEKWVHVEAYIWDGEKWRPVSVPKTYVYENGVTNEALVGSWDSKKDAKGVITWNADSLYLGYTGDQARYASVFTTKAIDLTNYSKLCVVVSGTSGTKEGAACVTKETSQNVALETVLSKMAAYVRIPVDVADKATYEADISTLEGEHYIQLVAAVFKGTFHEVYLV
jgi:hypothetical protein